MRAHHPACVLSGGAAVEDAHGEPAITAGGGAASGIGQLTAVTNHHVAVRIENLDVDPPRRLVQSFRAQWSDDVKSEGTSTVTWEIEPVGDSCRLLVTHSDLREGANDELYGGWPMILSGLKTLLETGEKLTTPGSLMYESGLSGDS
jgi:hypothetical protein